MPQCQPISQYVFFVIFLNFYLVHNCDQTIFLRAYCTLWITVYILSSFMEILYLLFDWDVLIFVFMKFFWLVPDQIYLELQFVLFVTVCKSKPAFSMPAFVLICMLFYSFPFACLLGVPSPLGPLATSIVIPLSLLCERIILTAENTIFEHQRYSTNRVFCAY